jgi:hypothetical protein
MPGIQADLFSSRVLRDQGSLLGLRLGQKRLGNPKQRATKTPNVHYGPWQTKQANGEMRGTITERKHGHDHVRYGSKTNNPQRPENPIGFAS